MIRGPPEPPATAITLPSSSSTIVGVIALSGRFPGVGALRFDCISPKALALPLRTAKSSMVSLRQNPNRSTATSEPNSRLIVSVHATAFPSASTTLKCDVPRSSGGGGATPYASCGFVHRRSMLAAALSNRSGSSSSPKGTSTKSLSANHRARSANACFAASQTSCTYSGELCPFATAARSASPRRSNIENTCACTSPPLLGGGIDSTRRPMNAVASAGRIRVRYPARSSSVISPPSP